MVARVYSLLERFRDDLSRLWNSGAGIWLLVLGMIAGLYFVAISKLTELIVGGF